MKEITHCDECKYYKRSLWKQGKFDPKPWCTAPIDSMKWLGILIPTNESLKTEVCERQCSHYEPKEEV